MSAPNPIIGSVPCPVGTCGKACAVRKFAQRSITDSGKRKAGKFYFDCPTHGRFGFDGNAAMQEHVLETITWSNDQLKSEHGEPASPASAASAQPTAQPAKSSAAAPPKASTQKPPPQPARSTRPWWEDLL